MLLEALAKPVPICRPTGLELAVITARKRVYNINLLRIQLPPSDPPKRPRPRREELPLVGPVAEFALAPP
jgi:hypothetical protein